LTKTGKCKLLILLEPFSATQIGFCDAVELRIAAVL
jgi:hypothetical protein